MKVPSLRTAGKANHWRNEGGVMRDAEWPRIGIGVLECRILGVLYVGRDLEYYGDAIVSSTRKALVGPKILQDDRCFKENFRGGKN